MIERRRRGACGGHTCAHGERGALLREQLRTHRALALAKRGGLGRERGAEARLGRCQLLLPRVARRLGSVQRVARLEGAVLRRGALRLRGERGARAAFKLGRERRRRALARRGVHFRGGGVALRRVTRARGVLRRERRGCRRVLERCNPRVERRRTRERAPEVSRERRECCGARRGRVAGVVGAEAPRALQATQRLLCYRRTRARLLPSRARLRAFRPGPSNQSF